MAQSCESSVTTIFSSVKFERRLKGFWLHYLTALGVRVLCVSTDNPTPIRAAAINMGRSVHVMKADGTDVMPGGARCLLPPAANPTVIFNDVVVLLVQLLAKVSVYF